jgi:triacylglycerol esterase/lipase EstA (alpha/beta hydrolase family)
MTVRQAIFTWQILEALFFWFIAVSFGIHGWQSMLVVAVSMIVARLLVVWFIATTVTLFFSTAAINLKQYLLLCWGEFTAFFILYFWFQAKPRLRNFQPASIANNHVILVHGFFCNDGFWFKLRPSLIDAGYSVSMIEMKPLFGSLDELAELATAEYHRIKLLNSSANVTFVGFSMGGLSIKAIDEKVQKNSNFIALDVPHQGTYLASVSAFLGSKNGQQMNPKSDWLQKNQKSKSQFKYEVGIWSAHDTIVVPARFGKPPVHSLMRKGKGHLNVAIDRALHKHIIRLLRCFNP